MALAAVAVQGVGGGGAPQRAGGPVLAGLLDGCPQLHPALPGTQEVGQGGQQCLQQHLRGHPRTGHKAWPERHPSPHSSSHRTRSPTPPTSTGRSRRQAHHCAFLPLVSPQGHQPYSCPEICQNLRQRCHGVRHEYLDKVDPPLREEDPLHDPQQVAQVAAECLARGQHQVQPHRQVEQADSTLRGSIEAPAPQAKAKHQPTEQACRVTGQLRTRPRHQLRA
mmetsp:Transcript_6100/g.9249  ORF Transcript_6100/g.9249 Transcript_6100/m.9249 type:complete len:222 (-) Transcript_6100:174-839(-)